MDRQIDFASWQKKNPDIFAWLYVPGAGIDQPICCSDTEQYYYMTHNNLKENSAAGAIFMENRNAKDFSDPCTVVYGHNIAGGKMFATLNNFEDPQFFQKNRYFYIYTPTKTFKYDIFTSYTADNRHILNSYDFKDPESRMKYFNFVVDPDSFSKQTTPGYSLSQDDKICLLSTCVDAYTYSTQRFIVAGKLTESKAIK